MKATSNRSRRAKATVGDVVGHVDPGLGPIAVLFGGEATVRHWLIAVGHAQIAVTGAVEVGVATVEQVEFRVSQCRVAVAV